MTRRYSRLFLVLFYHGRGTISHVHTVMIRNITILYIIIFKLAIYYSCYGRNWHK